MKGTYRLLAALLIATATVAVMRSQAFDNKKEQKAKTEQSDRQPQDGQEWFGRGYELHSSGRYREAIFAFKRAVDLGYRKEKAMYNIACGHAMLNEKDAALDWLEKSINEGFDDTHKVENDPDLASLRTDPRFSRIEDLSRTLSLSQFLSKGPTDSLRTKASWARAVELYESFLKREPASGRAWFNLGYALHNSQEPLRAIQAFEESLRLGYRSPTSMYNLGCSNAAAGNKDEAIRWIEKSLEAGFNLANYIDHDKDLDPLRSDPRFIRIQERVARQRGYEEKVDKGKSLDR